MNWKIVAREWLIFLGCVSGALVLIISHPRGADVSVFALLTLFLYAIVQVVRATIWAIKTVRRP